MKTQLKGAEKARKSYQTPKLVTHGDVQKLTLHHGCFSDIKEKWNKPSW